MVTKGLAGLRSWIGQHRFVVLLLLTLAIGAALQAFVAYYQWGDSSEGQYLQAALTVSQGGFPLVSFPTRPEPVNQWIMVPAIWLFGSGLLVGRGMIILLNVATAGTIALIAKRISRRSGEVAGLAAAALYLMAPLTASQGTMVDEEPVAALFLALSLYFLLRSEWKRWNWNYPISGLLLGLAILSRRTAVAVGIIWLLWIVHVEKGWKNTASAAVRCLLPGIVLVVGYFAYVVWMTSLAWGLTAFFDYSSVYAQLVIPLQYRIGIFGYLFIIGLPFLLAPLALVANTLRGKGQAALWSVSILSISAVVLSLLVLYPSEADFGLTEDITPYLLPIVILTAVITTLIMLWESRSSNAPAITDWDDYLVVAGWAVAIFGFDLFQRTQPFATYSGDALAPLALLFGIWFETLVPEHIASSSDHAPVLSEANLARYGFPLAIVAMLVISSSAVTLTMLGPTSAENGVFDTSLRASSIYRYPPEELSTVGSYLDHAMRPNDTLFTFDTLFADAAGKQISPEMAQYIDPYLNYLGLNAGAGVSSNHIPPGPSNQSPYPDAPPGFIPSTDGLMADWNSTHLDWLVDGYITGVVLEESALLNWYIKTYFHPVRSFGDAGSYDEVVIYHRGPLPSLELTPVTSNVTGGSTGGAVSDNGTVYVTHPGEPYLTYLNTSGTSGTVPIDFGGSGSIGLFFGDLWIGSSTSPQVEVLPIGGGPPQVLDVGTGNYSFSSDAGRGEVIVAANGSQRLTAFTISANDTWWSQNWTVKVDTSITSLAVNATSHLLYAAAPSKDSLLIFDDRDGAPVGVWVAPFQPTYLLFSDNGLIAAWQGGLIFRLNLTNGTLPGELGAIFVGPGVTGVVAIPSFDAVAISRQRSNTTALADARTLFVLGSFGNVSCPGSTFWDPENEKIGTTDPCTTVVTWWSLPPLVTVSVNGPAGASVILNNNPLANYSLPLTLRTWPQIIIVSANHPGYLSGFAETTAYSNSSMTVGLGPSVSGLNETALDYTVEVVLVSVLTFIGGAALITWGDDPVEIETGPRESDGSGPSGGSAKSNSEDSDQAVRPSAPGPP